MRTIIPNEQQARALDFCPACGSGKDRGALVCWHCFKVSPPHCRDHDPDPLKYADVPFWEWLSGRPADRDLEERIKFYIEPIKPVNPGAWQAGQPAAVDHLRQLRFQAELWRRDNQDIPQPIMNEILDCLNAIHGKA